jgi:hypothetical protein
MVPNWSNDVFPKPALRAISRPPFGSPSSERMPSGFSGKPL